MDQDEKRKSLKGWVQICSKQNKLIQHIVIELDDLKMDIKSKLAQIQKRIQDNITSDSKD